MYWRHVERAYAHLVHARKKNFSMPLLRSLNACCFREVAELNGARRVDFNVKPGLNLQPGNGRAWLVNGLGNRVIVEIK